MKITPEYLQQIIQEETNILLFEKRLGRELTTEEIERLRELRGIRSSSEKSAEKAWEKELEKIRAGESDEEREAADARQAQYARALAIQQAQLDIPIDRTPGGRKSPQAAADPPKELAQQAQQEAEAEDLQTIVDQQHEKGKEDKLLGQVMSLIGGGSSSSIAALEIYEKIEAVAWQDDPGLADPLNWGKEHADKIGMVPYEDKKGRKGWKGWKNVWSKSAAGQKYIAQWKKDALKDNPDHASGVRHHMENNLDDAYRAAVFVKLARQGNLKELLLPLITQVLKENTK